MTYVKTSVFQGGYIVSILPGHDDGFWAPFGSKRRNVSPLIERLQVEQKVMQFSISFVGFNGESTGTTYTAAGSGLDVFTSENRGSPIIGDSRGGMVGKKCRKDTNYGFNWQLITFCSE